MNFDLPSGTEGVGSQSSTGAVASQEPLFENQPRGDVTLNIPMAAATVLPLPFLPTITAHQREGFPGARQATGSELMNQHRHPRLQAPTSAPVDTIAPPTSLQTSPSASIASTRRGSSDLGSFNPEVAHQNVPFYQQNISAANPAIIPSRVYKRTYDEMSRRSPPRRLPGLIDPGRDETQQTQRAQLPPLLTRPAPSSTSLWSTAHEYSSPSTFANMPPNDPVIDTPIASRIDPKNHRFSLHIRQEPRAARAGPDGKDRRAIDPPPVLQLMIRDFDPHSTEDMSSMRSYSWVVHTRLIPTGAPQDNLNPASQATVERINYSEVSRLLLGTAVSSPFFCADDPDLPSAPEHPSSTTAPPPSPSLRFIQTASKSKDKDKPGQNDPRNLPGAFFIFADLSVRKAGQYRLEFNLMKMEPELLQTGSVVPCIASATSQTFNVVNAKDFDQVQPSTQLVKGLLNRGAGFPLKLKKGVREGQRRKSRTSEQEEVPDDGQSEDEEDDADDEG